LHRNKLIYHECKKYDGYRLTYLGYDYLALRTYVARGLISGLGRRIGVGKEADIYEVRAASILWHPSTCLG
jgi:RIO kinase 2